LVSVAVWGSFVALVDHFIAAQILIVRRRSRAPAAARSRELAGPAGAVVEQRNQWLCASVRGSVSLLRLPAFARPRLTR
jgi:hypothetical protein